eukprot:CAMPEP_0174240760 /NCGR_PEP_ID=MMETSP0417-20130205/20342_1 /TAXON_ID=242541 /ORGANISM="Mayorella sp, Strain BSH-02190019" /LENGTH=562 /DNA_ID=CAMNT_0015319897 /DNA_START=1258 /DNA_END=2942 /DNA_ORIENTATION=+
MWTQLRIEQILENTLLPLTLPLNALRPCALSHLRMDLASALSGKGDDSVLNVLALALGPLCVALLLLCALMLASMLSLLILLRTIRAILRMVHAPLQSRRRVYVTVMHPDLGLGGAERLVIDAAVALQNQGHVVTVYTTHRDPSHCFQESIDGTLDVRVHGDFLPRHILGRCHALCAIVRMIYLSMVVAIPSEPTDVVFCDVLSITIPLMKLLVGAKVLFYCHYPDKLLCTADQRTSLLKRVYRVPLDWIEEKTTGMADCIFVNSQYTAGVYAQAFPRLTHHKPEVLYPALNFDNFVQAPSSATESRKALEAHEWIDKPYVLSINRFERKKNIGLAIEAFAELAQQGELGDLQLVLAGGYDPRVAENREYAQELQSLVKNTSTRLKLKTTLPVHFFFSFTDEQKVALLYGCRCLVYTPSNEHFGIVPLEAMYCGKPVIAVNSGGPLESVKHEETGFLCEPDPTVFANAIRWVSTHATESIRMGEQGRHRVEELFSLPSFASQLNRALLNVLKVNTSARRSPDTSTDTRAPATHLSAACSASSSSDSASRSRRLGLHSAPSSG